MEENERTVRRYVVSPLAEASALLGIYQTAMFTSFDSALRDARLRTERGNQRHYVYEVSLTPRFVYRPAGVVGEVLG